MNYGDEELKDIYDRTSGYCHLCHRKMSLSNYGRPGARGAWEIEHSRPRVKGGTDHGNNLYGAHIKCNRAKGTCGTRTARGWNGKSCAPLSREKRKQARQENTLAGGAAGALIGGAFAGPPGALIGGLIGALVGNKENPDRK